VRTLIVGGTFDSNGGRPSGYIRKLFRDSDGVIINGGDLKSLEDAFQAAQTSAELIFWMPDVDNSLPKYVNQIKAENPTAYLVISKSNIGGKYSTLELIARALDAKANLLVEFTKREDAIVATVLDPLGNAFVYREPLIQAVYSGMMKRIQEISQFTRVRSVPTDIPRPPMNDDQLRFIEIAKTCAERFHSLVHAVNQGRFIGNLSFRCEGGFPSMRSGNGMYVSRRNVDKRELSPADMVYVPLSGDTVIYAGNKPSVDTPVQKELYLRYPDVNYMLHGHVYVPGAAHTLNPTPCGAIEEVDEVGEVVSSLGGVTGDGIAVNLLGHGFLIMAKNLSAFDNIEFVQRPIPELL